MGDVKAGSRKRAVGTRDRIMTHLLAIGEVSDTGGKASTELAAAIGYPGSSVAFAQLLTGMERSGLIEREIRGKRTYRIAPTGAAGQGGAAASGRATRTGPSRPGQASAVAAGSARVGSAGAGPGAAIAARRAGQHPGADDATGRGLAVGVDVDYDELARRLLVQVVQRLAVSPGGPLPGEEDGDVAEPAVSGQGAATLEKAVASLEQKLASATSRQRRLTAENAKLREQLRAAQQSLAEAQERVSADAIAGRFDTAEVLLLERLLSPLRDKRDRREEAGAG